MEIPKNKAGLYVPPPGHVDCGAELNYNWDFIGDFMGSTMTQMETKVTGKWQYVNLSDIGITRGQEESIEQIVKAMPNCSTLIEYVDYIKDFYPPYPSRSPLKTQTKTPRKW